jgi:RNA polymerase sigma factor (sigma-70 family)
MDDSPLTRPSLLVRIRDPRDAQAWAEFVDVYAPLVYGFARKHRLQDADAADLTQDVLRAIAGAVGRLNYDPERGSFRAWLFTVVRNKLRNFLARKGRHCQGSGDSAAQDLLNAVPAAQDEDSSVWDLEYEKRVFGWAVKQVRGGFEDSTWQAFWLTAVEGKEPKDAASALGITVGAVYIAKSRVLARLRKKIEQLQGSDPHSLGGSS